VADPILVVNAGSSTLKLSVVRSAGAAVGSSTLDPWDGAADSAADAISALVGAGPIRAVGHRVVHGGASFTGPVLVDAETRDAIAALTPLAPLHQPGALAGIDAARRVVGDVPSVACFDTAFHAHLPIAAATYALPAEWRARWPLRRYGFHGLSHRWAAGRAALLLDRPVDELAVVTCHLGAGASLCAVAGGASVDTTMGFTPLEGLVMATRSGSVDPGLLVWLLRQGLTLDELEEGLEHGSGLLGLAGTDDLREVLAARARHEPAARTAFEVYVHRLCREVAAMTAALGRVDAIVFTGGAGERSPVLRSAVGSRLGYLGIVLDEAANAAAGADASIGSPGARVDALVVTAREDLEIAGLVEELMAR
jgi:acetate kinase